MFQGASKSKVNWLFPAKLEQVVKAGCEPNNLCDFVAPQSAMDESAFGDNSSSSDSGGSSGSSDLTSSANCKAMTTEQVDVTSVFWELSF